MNQAVTKRQSRNAAIKWGGVVVGLLLLQVALGAAGIIAAHTGKGREIEANYYDKALHWDQQKAINAAAHVGEKAN